MSESLTNKYNPTWSLAKVDHPCYLSFVKQVEKCALKGIPAYNYVVLSTDFEHARSHESAPLN